MMRRWRLHEPDRAAAYARLEALPAWPRRHVISRLSCRPCDRPGPRLAGASPCPKWSSIPRSPPSTPCGWRRAPRGSAWDGCRFSIRFKWQKFLPCRRTGNSSAISASAVPKPRTTTARTGTKRLGAAHRGADSRSAADFPADSPPVKSPALCWPRRGGYNRPRERSAIGADSDRAGPAAEFSHRTGGARAPAGGPVPAPASAAHGAVVRGHGR